MEQLARDDISAAAAAHRELGRDYDGAVAEGLIERIGAEIDKRVDARLGDRDDKPVQRGKQGQPALAAHTGWPAAVFGLGSLAIGGLTTSSVLSNGPGVTNADLVIVVMIWIIIGIINVAYARRR